MRKQLKKKRKNLANCRKGEYEGLRKKLSDSSWKPIMAHVILMIQLRSLMQLLFLLEIFAAYNVNLNTTSTRRANAIAFDIREAGRIKREGNT